ncbi:PREDICTED: uncharacterized protein LOC109130475 [Camelina sativa]|uniref:Uncharacterized protein LOC109130475 n=1 Tax=Camelina sativa TaxID=90675 RepID=A0ABM1R9A9_CAMSA|nr:PREDICTED: uncharacterized protein LOC109130475 [Camelina sativa]
MVEEINAQLREHSLDLTPPASNRNVITCKWIFTLKYHADGSIAIPVIKSTTISLVVEIAVKKNWVIHQVDINNSFLQGTLHDEVYVSQPSGFVDRDRPHHVCRLRKALHGLKQAPRAWYQELRHFLLQSGYKTSVRDNSLFVYKHAPSHVYVLVYVDDIIITGPTSLVSAFNSSLAHRFSLKYLGPLSYFLGIEATRTSSGLHLMQRKYITDLLVKTKMQDAKRVPTPMSSSSQITVLSGTPLADAKEYCMVVGSLQYLAFTRPDIAFPMNRLSQFMHRPTNAHWQAVKRVLRYLAGTWSHGIFLRRDAPLTVHAFSNADWGRDKANYVSMNAYLLYFGGSLVSWSSKKQRSVSRSSIEAEYRAIANTTSELKWICSLLTELGIEIPMAPVAHISGDDQIADALTKLLPPPPFLDLNFKIGVKKLLS